MSHRKIRVLQLIDTFNVGGAEKLVLSLAANTDPRRFQVIPCALFGSGPLEEEMKTGGIPYRILGLPRRSILTGLGFINDVSRIVTAIRKMLDELSIDILHTHLTSSTLVGVLATWRKNGPPLCATVHSIVFDNQRSRLSPRAWLMRAGIRATFPRASRIITVSDRVAEAVQLYTGMPNERITTIVNGIDANRFQSGELRSNLRRKLDLPMDRPIVVSVGRLTRPKGYPYLLAALASIPSEERPMALIVGDGPDRADLELQMATLKLGCDVRLLGNRQDVSELLAASDVFVLASLWEGLPLALLESMAAGLPAVVTAVGEIPQVIESGKSGLLVSPKDSAALANALRALLRDRLNRIEMGQAARERFAQEYGLQRLIASHESMYEEMVAERLKVTSSKART